jgi:hypothetical protein
MVRNHAANEVDISVARKPDVHALVHFCVGGAVGLRRLRVFGGSLGAVTLVGA